MTPEEIVGLIGNIANRPDIREVQERQIREIKNLLKNQLTTIKTLIENEIKPAIDYLDKTNSCAKACDAEVNFHQPECAIASGMHQLIWTLDNLEKKQNEIPTR